MDHVRPDSDRRSTARAIVGAAALIAVGNIASRVLGLGREAAIANFFGRTPEADAFTLAWTIPNTIYDLLISGAVSAALVPVLSEYAEGEEREFGRVTATIFAIVLSALAALLALAAWQMPLLIGLLVQPSQAALRDTTATLAMILLPAVLLMAISGLTTAVLHARRSFLSPAFVGAVFNAGIIAGMVLFHAQLGVTSIAIGVLFGGIAQVLIQLPGLRGVNFRAGIDWRHPAVRRILRLYAPVAIGISFSIIGTVLDRWLASGLPNAPNTMRYATTLVQFPLGLVAAAVSLAVLPTLSRQDADNDREAFRSTLAMGLKVVLVLIVPATLGLAALAEPLVRLLFQRGAFAAEDTPAVAAALFGYLPGLPAAALDQVILFAFYARKRTLAPNLVQGAAIAMYLLSALPLLWLTQLGVLALVLGNSVQWIAHALILWWLIRRDVPLGGLRIGETALKASLAALLMAGGVWGVAHLTSAWPTLLSVGSAAALGGALYLGLGLLLRIEALQFFLQALLRRIKR